MSPQKPLIPRRTTTGIDPMRQAVIQVYQAFQKDPLFRPYADFVYERIEKIGVGGMGVVYRVFDRRNKREAALKVLLDPEADEGITERFVREARVTALLEHPSIPPVYEFGRSGRGDFYILMKLVRGETLSHKIRELHARPDPRNLAAILRALLRVCEALAYAHDKGVLHRDLKPENIMIGRHGDVYVMDWGFARDHREAEDEDREFRLYASQVGESVFGKKISNSGGILGTFGYMSPEQASGEEIDGRADIFSIGAIIYELIAGLPPIQAPGMAGVVAAMKGEISYPRTFGRGFPPRLVSLARRCLEADRDRRPADPDAVTAELRLCLAAITNENEGPPPQRRGELLLVAAGLIAAAVIVAAAAGLFAPNRAPLRPPSLTEACIRLLEKDPAAIEDLERRGLANKELRDLANALADHAALSRGPDPSSEALASSRARIRDARRALRSR